VTAFGFGADRFGWTDEALELVHRLRGWTETAIERLELEWREGDVRPVGFPVRDATGERVGALRYDPTGRAEPKMLAEAGSTRELFPPPETIPDGVDRLILTEGEPDCVAAWSAGFAAVAVPGTAGWKDEYAGRFSGRRWTVYVVFDCDEAGRAAAVTVAASLVAAGVDARIVDLDPSRNGI
jgi:Toprim-like